MRRIFFYSFFLTLVSLANGQTLKCHKNFTSVQLKEDLLVLKTTLQEAHPDLYRVNSKEIIDKRFISIENNLGKGKSYLGFLKLLVPLFTEIGDINTQWGHSTEYIRYRNEKVKLFPLKIKIVEEKFYVEDNFGPDTSVGPGAEILKINGESVSEYLQKNFSLLPTDGQIKTVQLRWLETYFAQHHSNFWEQCDTFKLEMKIAGKTEKKKISALYKKDMQAKIESARSAIPDFDFKIKDKVAIITLRSFSQAGGIEAGAFIDTSFRMVARQNMKEVILDLRGEGFGHLTPASLLCTLLGHTGLFEDNIKRNILNLSYKKYTVPPIFFQHKELEWAGRSVFTGSVYIITDGFTTYSKGYFCARMKDAENVFFIGEETGSCTFGMNAEALTLTLPNSGITVYIPTLKLVAWRKEKNSLHGVNPDFPMSGQDSKTIVDSTIEIIKKKRN